VSAFDQARNIGQHEFTAVDVDHAELRMQRGERIVGDLRLGCADGGEEGRFAGVRQADDSCIGNQLEPELDGEFGPGLTGVGMTRCAVGRSFEMSVAEAAIAAMRERDGLTDGGEIGEKRDPVFLVDLRADRQFERDIVAVGAMPVLAHPGAPIAGGEVLLVAVVDQRIEPIDRLRDHVPALAAIAAIGAAEFDELLAPERDAAVAAVAGADINLGFVEKFHWFTGYNPHGAFYAYLCA